LRLPSFAKETLTSSRAGNFYPKRSVADLAAGWIQDRYTCLRAWKKSVADIIDLSQVASKDLISSLVEGGHIMAKRREI